MLGRLNSRVVMSAMTRGFAGPSHQCSALMADYYEKRAAGGVGLILTEGIVIDPSGDGYRDVPRLHTEAQMKSWRPAIDAVHQHGAKIFAQLWHCGRISHPDYTDGAQPVSSTGVEAAGINRQNNKPYATPRALRADEMAQIGDLFARSALLAMEAGFDGVQAHMGHGYLIDQFLDARVNDRTDLYGGSVENRCRLACQVLSAIVAAVGVERTAVRISPSRMMGGLYEWPDLEPMLALLFERFDGIGLRMLDVSCANANYFQTSGKIIARYRPLWPHLMLGGASLSLAEATGEVACGHLDMVTWGRALIANPDLPKKLRDGLAIVPFDDSMRATLV